MSNRNDKMILTTTIQSQVHCLANAIMTIKIQKKIIVTNNDDGDGTSENYRNNGI